jgi:hypothetical protein
MRAVSPSTEIAVPKLVFTFPSEASIFCPSVQIPPVGASGWFGFQFWYDTVAGPTRSGILPPWDEVLGTEFVFKDVTAGIAVAITSIQTNIPTIFSFMLYVPPFSFHIILYRLFWEGNDRFFSSIHDGVIT